MCLGPVGFVKVPAGVLALLRVSIFILILGSCRFLGTSDGSDPALEAKIGKSSGCMHVQRASSLRTGTNKCITGYYT